jgi:hypothetical protein
MQIVSIGATVNIAAVCFGFVASIWLCYGAALAEARTMHRMGTWDGDQYMSEMLIAQSAQYAAGGSLLVATFLLQAVGALVDQHILQSPMPLQIGMAGLGLVSLLTAIPCAYLIFRTRQKSLRSQLARLREQRVAA